MAQPPSIPSMSHAICSATQLQAVKHERLQNARAGGRQRPGAAPAGVRPSRAGGPPAGARGGHCRGAARGGPRAAPGRSRLPHGARRVRRRRRPRDRRRRRAHARRARRRAPVGRTRLDQGQGGVGVSRSPVGLLDAAAALARGAAPVVVDAAAPSLGELDAALPGLVAAAGAPRARPSSSSSRARRCGRQKVSSSRPSAGESKRGESRTWLTGFPTGEAGARAAPARRLAPRRRLADAPATPAGVRLTPDAAVGLLVGIAFVAVSLLGLTCIGAVQTPSRFATAHPPSTKEF